MNAQRGCKDTDNTFPVLYETSSMHGAHAVAPQRRAQGVKERSTGSGALWMAAAVCLAAAIMVAAPRGLLPLTAGRDAMQSLLARAELPAERAPMLVSAAAAS